MPPFFSRKDVAIPVYAGIYRFSQYAFKWTPAPGQEAFRGMFRGDDERVFFTVR